MVLGIINTIIKLMAQDAKQNAMCTCDYVMEEIITAKKQKDNHFVHCKSI